MIQKGNPEAVAPPIGSYHHVAVVPRGAELVVLSGQIGCDRQGNVPGDVETQFAYALENVKALLASEGMSPKHVCKVNIWFTEQIKREQFVEIWDAFHQGDPPATMLAYVQALVRPDLKVEVEAWAAR
ncbi:RidA family protein [Ectobacillus ponti]|uniref:RidA family protein n=1 Tax=Ectobacillus ponti TaxID=2961894 RepID=A0AA41X6U1_9BACI|nr:RidA family protein [Ectobacillus ponti]MCP8969787.1 RidA family protein [Ectobacillus ponti]